MAGEPSIRLLNRAKSSRRLSVPIPGIIDKQRHLSLMYQPPFSISSAAINPHEDVGINDGINVGINLTPAQQRLVELIKRQPRLSVREMAERLELSQRQAERVVASLREKNVIWRVGSNKSGYWEVLD